MYAQQGAGDGIKTIIDQVRMKYAPDKRTALFNVDYKLNGQELTLQGETNQNVAKEELLGLLKGYKVVDEVTVLPAKELEGYVKGVVTISVANLRSKPSHPAELVTQALLGTPLEVLKSTEDNWYLVQT
ncbi:MAG: SH3 domain-containing protein, partial [Chlorobiota bacterium]